MSIDLSKAKAISDQYGAWKQLADASGRVLWSAAKPMVTVTLHPGSQTVSYYAYIIIDGIKYEGLSQKLEVPVGTIVECWVLTESKYESARVDVKESGLPYFATVYTNGDRDTWGVYNYTVTTNVQIEVWYDEDDEKGDRYGHILIYES